MTAEIAGQSEIPGINARGKVKATKANTLK